MLGCTQQHDQTPAPPVEYTYRHPHPAVAVDLAIFTVRDSALHVLLIERRLPPFQGRWALPGVFMRIEEDLLGAATRELREETGVDGAYLEQVGAFGAVDRDPRERVVSIAYFAVVGAEGVTLRPGTDAAAAVWWPYSRLPVLAFDHMEILVAAHDRVKAKLRTSAIAFNFLPREFTLTELQKVHEAISAEALDKRNFRKWVTHFGLVSATGRFRQVGRHRPAELFRRSRASQLVGIHPIAPRPAKSRSRDLSATR